MNFIAKLIQLYNFKAMNNFTTKFYFYMIKKNTFRHIRNNDWYTPYRLVNIPCVNDEKSYSPPNLVGMLNGPVDGLLVSIGFMLGPPRLAPYILKSKINKADCTSPMGISTWCIRLVIESICVNKQDTDCNRGLCYLDVV